MRHVSIAMLQSLAVACMAIAASCSGEDVASIPTSLARLKATAHKPSDISDAEIEELCRSITWPGNQPFAVVTAIEGWNVTVRISGYADPALPGTRLLVTSPEGPRGLMLVREIVAGHALGQFVSTVPNRIASVGDYAQPIP